MGVSIETARAIWFRMTLDGENGKRPTCLSHHHSTGMSMKQYGARGPSYGSVLGGSLGAAKDVVLHRLGDFDVAGEQFKVESFHHAPHPITLQDDLCVFILEFP